jgi:hypothetical protein
MDEINFRMSISKDLSELFKYFRIFIQFASCLALIFFDQVWNVIDGRVYLTVVIWGVTSSINNCQYTHLVASLLLQFQFYEQMRFVLGRFTLDKVRVLGFDLIK